MKHQLLIILFICQAIFSGAAMGDVRKPHDIALALVFVADEKGPKQHFFLINGRVAFKTVEGLKKYLTGLPPDSKLTWAPGCLRMGNEPLLESEKEMKEFKEFCKSQGIHFVLVPSG